MNVHFPFPPIRSISGILCRWQTPCITWFCKWEKNISLKFFTLQSSMEKLLEKTTTNETVQAVVSSAPPLPDTALPDTDEKAKELWILTVCLSVKSLSRKHSNSGSKTAFNYMLEDEFQLMWSFMKKQRIGSFATRNCRDTSRQTTFILTLRQESDVEAFLALLGLLRS